MSASRPKVRGITQGDYRAGKTINSHTPLETDPYRHLIDVLEERGRLSDGAGRGRT
jgi:hypothetical protein